MLLGVTQIFYDSSIILTYSQLELKIASHPHVFSAIITAEQQTNQISHFYSRSFSYSNDIGAGRVSGLGRNDEVTNVAIHTFIVRFPIKQWVEHSLTKPSCVVLEKRTRTLNPYKIWAQSEASRYLYKFDNNEER